MLDTIRVKYRIMPTDDQLAHWKWNVTQSEGKFRQKFIYNFMLDAAMLKFTYYPIGYNGEALLALELSLPKLMFGNNHEMISSIDETIEFCNERLQDVPNVPALDLAEGVLIRLDMCYNHQVKDAVGDYVAAIGNLEYPHRRTKHHRYEGVEFRAKHKTTKFYNKERESGYKDAAGILRQETTILKAKDIQKLLNVKKPTLQDVSKDLVVVQLQNDLAKLRLLGNSIATRDTALKALCEAHGEMAGMYYYGLLISKLDKSKKDIVSDTEMHPRSLDRKLRKIVDAGLPLTLTDHDVPLPPLEIIL
jgi:hypothetical protein